MANTKLDYKIPIGILKKTRKFINGHLSVKSLFAEIFDWMHVPFSNECCTTLADSAPVRFVSATQALEYFNGTTWIAADDTVVSVATGLTAHAGGTQGAALALTAQFNEITTSATAGDSVKLPLAVVGLKTIIKNNGATAIDVFPATGDSINTLAVNTAIRIAPGDIKSFHAMDSTVWESSEEKVAVVDGAVGAPAYSFNTQPDMGYYKVSSTQLGVAVSGVLQGGWNASGMFTDSITEKTTGSGITLAKAIIRKTTAAAINSTNTATAAQVAGGLITSTSGAATSITLPTATQLATQLGAVQGTSFEFIVDNTAGANTVTIVVGAGITAVSAITGGTSLTIAQSATSGVAVFRLTFFSAIGAILSRVA